MLAFKGDPALKERFVNRAIVCQTQGDYAQNYGFYKKDQSTDRYRGSAIGCLAQTNSDPARALQNTAGIPEALSYACDEIFENLPSGEYETYTVRFVRSIRVGSDLSAAIHLYLVWLLGEALPKCYDEQQFSAVKLLADKSRVLHSQCLAGQTPPEATFKELANSASLNSNILSNVYAYSNQLAAKRATYANYVVNYSLRVLQIPRTVGYIVTSANNCGITYQMQGEKLLTILTEIKPVAVEEKHVVLC